MIRVLFIVIAALLPLTGLAWNSKGHRIVGELAAAELTPQARLQVAQLLQGEPDPTLAGVSTWADELRDTDPEKSKQTARWHFINFQGGAAEGAACLYAPARDCPDGQCVVAAINRSFLALADRKRPLSERRDALKFLVHFIGDVHQPLHASPRKDRGGNDYQVSIRNSMGPAEGSNLHSVWDGLILKRVALEPRDYAAALRKQTPLPRDPTRSSQTPALDWAVESCKLIELGRVYPSKHVIDDAYLDAHRPLAEQRLRQAGSRLAAMINYALR